MARVAEYRGGELPSGGVPVLVPNPCGVAPDHVQARVKAEIMAKRLGRRDACGRPLRVVTRTVNGSYIGGLNRITLPKVEAFECMVIKEEMDKRAGRV